MAHQTEARTVDQHQHQLWRSIKTDRSVYVSNEQSGEFGYLYSEVSRGEDAVDLLKRQAVQNCVEQTGRLPTRARISWTMFGHSKTGGLLAMEVVGQTVPATTRGHEVSFAPAERSTSLSAWGWVSMFSQVKGIRAAVAGSSPPTHDGRQSFPPCE